MPFDGQEQGQVKRRKEQGMEEEKLKILVVDDEMPVRQELAAFPWERVDCVLVGEAKNGKEALQLCAELHPDIIISDIEMPVMGGLEFTAALHKLYPNIQMIILTGHENFDYVKTALRLHVLDYIVKFEMSEATVSEVIQRARRKLEENGVLQRSVYARQRRSIVKCLVKLLDADDLESADMQEVEKNLQQLNLLPCGGEGCCFLVTFVPEEYQAAISEEIAGYLDGHDRIANWCMLRTGIYVVRMKGESWTSSRGKFLALSDEIMELVMPLLEIRRPFVVHYEGVHTIKRFVSCLREIPVWFDNYFYASHKQIFEGDRLFHTVANEETNKELEHIFTLLGYENKRFKALFMEYTARRHIDTTELKRYGINWMEGYLRRNNKEGNTYLYEEVNEAMDVEELADCLCQVCMYEAKYREEIAQAVSIIRKEYPERLVLKDVSERVGLSAQYFSRVFREETGKTFSDYLIQIRIEQAQELLRQGRFKVYEIAEMVGIPNYRYFSTLFKKIAGYTPKQGRKGQKDE